MASCEKCGRTYGGLSAVGTCPECMNPAPLAIPSTARLEALEECAECLSRVLMLFNRGYSSIPAWELSAKAINKLREIDASNAKGDCR